MMPTVSSICVCPQCRSPLEDSSGSWVCQRCKTRFPILHGFVDFAPEVKTQGGIGQWGMEVKPLVAIYEGLLRPNFVRSMGRNWDGSLTPADEDQYLQNHVQPAGDLVLDLACGAGRWTRTLVNRFGKERVVGFDLSYASLRASRAVLPDTLLLRGNAWTLPFADQTVAAINCSNSLQLIPDTPQVLREVGRTLAPGGTFTCFTFRKSPPGSYRTFQATLERILSVRAFSMTDIEAWLNAASLELIDVSGANLVLLFTARKIA